MDTLNITDRRAEERRLGERRETKFGTTHRQFPRIRKIQLPAAVRSTQDRRSAVTDRRKIPPLAVSLLF